MNLTVDKIEDKLASYKRFYEQLHFDQQEIDDYYELVFDAGVPSEYPARMPDTARNWVDAGVRNYTLDNPKSKVLLRKDSESARRQVEKLEMFYNFFLCIYIKEIKKGARKLLKRGEVFFRIGMDDTYFGSEAEERLFHWPLGIIVPDPINTFASPAHNGLVPHDVIEKYKITASEAEAICDENKWEWKRDRNPDEFIDWMAYTDAKVRCFILDKTPVLTPSVQPNILGFCPYVHTDAGIGDDSYEGKPEYLYRSIIWPRKDMLQMEVRNLSQIDAILTRFAWARWIAELGSEGDTKLIKELYSDGKIPSDPAKWIYNVKDRLVTKVMQGEQPPPALFTQLQTIQGYSSPPSVMSGVRPTGVYSGQHQELLMSTAKPIYKEPFKNLEDALGVLMGMGARIIEKVYGYPVQIKNFSDPESKAYFTITPEDINGHYDCEVQLLAEPPEATDHRKYLGANFYKSDVISLYQCLRGYFDMSEKEAMDEIGRIFAIKGLSSVGALDAMAKDGMERLGMEKELEILREAEKNAVKNVPPPNRRAVSTEEIGVEQMRLA